MNFALVGYGYTDGNVLVDASIPWRVRDLGAQSRARLFEVAESLGRQREIGVSSRMAGLGARFSWPRTIAGSTARRSRCGSRNFISAPADASGFRGYESGRIVGASFRVGMPLGQYDEDKLLNLGLNRWSFKPELGMSKPWRRWTFELATAATFYTDNNEFLGSSTRAQEPLIAVQGHVIYCFGKGIWAGLDGTFYTGGRTTLNGTVNDDRQSSSRVGLTVSLPVTRQQSLKLYASTGATARAGGDFTTAGVIWQYRWGGKTSADALEAK
jgi:hypothetical protein